LSAFLPVRPALLPPDPAIGLFSSALTIIGSSRRFRFKLLISAMFALDSRLQLVTGTAVMC
jgi:hypothetical protein